MKNEWISVNDRLPEKEMPVLVYIANRESIMLTMWVGDFTLLRVSIKDGFSGAGVTHWQPLPEPPKK